MQIIIVQNEIEEAIRNHINNQINVKEGMRIDIDLSATRGPEGFKATIDIVADTAPRAEAPAAPAPAPVATPAAAAKPAPGIRRAPPKADPTPAQETAADVADTGPAEPAESATTEEAATPPVTGRSLFGGLTKPVNP